MDSVSGLIGRFIGGLAIIWLISKGVKKLLFNNSDLLDEAILSVGLATIISCVIAALFMGFEEAMKGYILPGIVLAIWEGIFSFSKMVKTTPELKD